MYKWIIPVIISIGMFAQPLCAEEDDHAIAKAGVMNVKMGREGNPYVVNGITWQDIYIEGTSFKVSASMPGSPTSMMMNGTLMLESDYQGTYYCFQTQSDDEEKPPKTYDDLVKLFGDKIGKWSTVAVNDKNIQYAAELTYIRDGGTGITRVFVTNHKIFIMKVLGKDLKLANEFFSTLTIEKLRK